MTLTKQRVLIALAASLLVLSGCSTKVDTTAKTSKNDNSDIPAEIDPLEKIDLSKFAPITENSTKEEVFAYAAALMTHARYKDAEPMLLALTKKHPELAGPKTNLAICYFHTDRLKDAEATFKQAIALKPANAAALDYSARIQRNDGKFEAAKELYIKAIEADPNYAPAQRNLAILYDLYLGQPKQALVHYQNYQRLIKEADKHVAIWIRDLANRTGTPLDAPTESNTKDSKEEL